MHTKLLAPVNSRIEDFLAKAPEPPAFLITRNAVHLLKVSRVRLLGTVPSKELEGDVLSPCFYIPFFRGTIHFLAFAYAQ